MVTANALANILPIGGVTTGEISDSYPDLFAPAPLTFAIWGVIYLLLALYVLYQLGFFSKKEKISEKAQEVLNQIAPYFVISSLANMMWIFAWHYDLIHISLILMLIILYSLIRIADLLREDVFNSMQRFFVKLPFSIYFGWITVATIANFTTFFVSIGWDGFGIAEEIWTVIILIVGAIVGMVRMFFDKNIAYGLVFVWAYLGILLKHITTFESEYSLVIITSAVLIFTFIVGQIYLFVKHKRFL